MSKPSLAFRTAIVAWICLLAACSDDPTVPPGQNWIEAPLPSLGGDAELLGVAARGSRGLAVGYVRLGSAVRPLVLENTGGGWNLLQIPEQPSEGILHGVALDASGRAIIVGGVSDSPILLDERGGWRAISLPGVRGTLSAVAFGSGETVRAVGTADGGLTVFSPAAGVWAAEPAGFTTPQEKGLLDVHHADGVFYACGWDDGGPPDLVIRENSGSGWQAVPLPHGADVPAGTDAEYRAIVGEPGAALWVGGTTVDFGGGTDVYTPSLSRRLAGGEWFEVVLPNPAAVQSVNDVLRASSGDLYLACGQDEAHVLRWDGTPWVDEGPGVRGQIHSLAESPSRVLYAVGWRSRSDGSRQALLLERGL